MTPCPVLLAATFPGRVPVGLVGPAIFLAGVLSMTFVEIRGSGLLIDGMAHAEDTPTFSEPFGIAVNLGVLL